MSTHPLRSLLLALLLALTAPAFAGRGFEPLFNGKDLAGWVLVGGHGPGYVVENGELVCPADGGGNLYTEKEYADFVFRFEFKLTPGGNNGVGLRAPLAGDPAYLAMECQILDDDAPQYAHLEPGQYHGSIYKVLPARRGALRPAGQWNREEIRVVGRRVKVVVNGKTIVEGDLNAVKDPHTLAEHPGLLRERGRIGFLGHGSEVRFRRIEVQDLTRPERDNRPPKGFVALFNGKNLRGWKGLVGNPVARAKMTSEERTQKEKAATLEALRHWSVQDGMIAYDGQNDSLCTVEDYADFELQVDWKIGPKGDSGIYLRGSPQVQIWDPADHPEGSGGLYNNQKHPNGPLVRADKPIGEWNRFVIRMVGERVTVYLNGELVVHEVPMENYWERNKPIYPAGQIELQHHGNPIYFKNIYLRRIQPVPAP